MLILCHEARRPIQERRPRERGRVMNLMSLIAESRVAADRHVDHARALGTPFGGHGATVLLLNVAQYIRVKLKTTQA
jgi:hypothetical protein